LCFNINGSTSNRSMRELYGYNGSTGSGTDTTLRIGYIPGSSATANTFGSGEVYIPNYTSSNNKSSSADGVSENNSALAVTAITANLWSNTSAITSITIYALNGNLVEFSEFALYGISSSSTQNTSVPLASGGDVISTDGTYWYHTFLYSGTFTPLKNLTCDYLVAAGGGGGNTTNAAGGGGGAGGVRSTVTTTGGLGTLETPLSMASNTAFTVTVGAGGAGVTASAYNSTISPGFDSSIAGTGITTVTSTGGGGGSGGGTSGGVNGGSGGSGGGGEGGYGTSGGTRTASPVQGFNGGNANASGGYAAGGGGGAGQVGAAGANPGSLSGKGGDGIFTAMTNAISVGVLSSGNYYIAGGGGGGSEGTVGAGGLGGGGAGGKNANGTNGLANTGSGGGGADTDSGSKTGGNGGSGIVIVRYAV
jgi:hypothetical protein